METATVTQPMTDPYPPQADAFNPDKKMYVYNDLVLLLTVSVYSVSAAKALSGIDRKRSKS